jgi:ABC-type transport system involved in cytochrome bd biosynthesis fused ATPase/permease subunit
MDASSLGEQAGTADGNMDKMRWNNGKGMRKYIFWITFIVFMIITMILAFTGGYSAGMIVLILTVGTCLSFLIAWVSGWFTEFKTSYRHAKLVQYCDQTKEYVTCVEKGTSKKECEKLPAMRQCIREQQRVEDQNDKLDAINRRLNRRSNRR